MSTLPIPAGVRLRSPRLFALLAAGLLLAHAALVVWAVRLALAVPTVWNWQPRDWTLAAIVAFVVCGIAVLRAPRHAPAAVALVSIAAAVILIGPGPVLVVAALLGAWFVAGDFLLARAFASRGPIEPPAPLIAVLAGGALWIGAMALLARARIHYPPVHAAAVALVLLAGYPRLRVAVPAWIEAWRTPADAGIGARTWTALLGTVAILHVIVAAKPEVGFDASTMHLQFAQMLAADHRFTFDVGRYAWALMPLGADHAFAVAWQLGGEAATHALNLAFGAIACAIVHGIVRREATADVATASVALIAGMPLAFLLTGTLFSEPLWIAFLVATFALATDARRGAPLPSSHWPAIAMLAGGAMATKVISAAWLLPLLLLAAAGLRDDIRTRRLGATGWAVIGLGALIGAWPYVNALLRTGNPVFPFMNAVFGSTVFPSDVSFDNPLYHAPLHLRTPYSIVVGSGRYIEGVDGAIGFHGLFVIPLVALALLRPSRATVVGFVVASTFFVTVWLQQSYLRYLAPALVLFAIVAAPALARLVATPATRALLLATGVALLALDLRFIYSAFYPHATPCLACLRDAQARARYVETYAPMRVVSAWLDRELPNAHVGFLVLNAPAPAGFTGPSHAANWHDNRFFRALVAAETAEDVLALVRRDRLTHVVVARDDPDAKPALRSFVARYTLPVHTVGDLTIARVEDTPR